MIVDRPELHPHVKTIDLRACGLNGLEYHADERCFVLDIGVTPRFIFVEDEGTYPVFDEIKLILSDMQAAVLLKSLRNYFGNAQWPESNLDTLRRLGPLTR